MAECPHQPPCRNVVCPEQERMQRAIDDFVVEQQFWENMSPEHIASETTWERFQRLTSVSALARFRNYCSNRSDKVLSDDDNSDYEYYDDLPDMDVVESPQMDEEEDDQDCIIEAVVNNGQYQSVAPANEQNQE